MVHFPNFIPSPGFAVACRRWFLPCDRPLRARQFPIMEGEFVVLRGPSGGGKTTLLNIIGCIDNATGGTMELFGQEISPKAPDATLASLRLNKIGFVFQVCAAPNLSTRLPLWLIDLLSIRTPPLHTPTTTHALPRLTPARGAAADLQSRGEHVRLRERRTPPPPPLPPRKRGVRAWAARRE